MLYYYPLYGQVPFQIPANLANLAQDSNDNNPTPPKSWCYPLSNNVKIFNCNLILINDLTYYNIVEVLKRKYQFSSDVKPEEKKVADVIEIKDDDNTDVEDFDLPRK
jgi:hypothetical protein